MWNSLRAIKLSVLNELSDCIIYSYVIQRWQLCNSIKDVTTFPWISQFIWNTWKRCISFPQIWCWSCWLQSPQPNIISMDLTRTGNLLPKITSDHPDHYRNRPSIIRSPILNKILDSYSQLWKWRSLLRPPLQPSPRLPYALHPRPLWSLALLQDVVDVECPSEAKKDADSFTTTRKKRAMMAISSFHQSMKMNQSNF